VEEIELNGNTNDMLLCVSSALQEKMDIIEAIEEERKCYWEPSSSK